MTPNRADPRLEARLIAPADETALIEAGRMVSVGLDPLAPFHVKALQQRGFLFGYGAVEVERIDAAMTSLASFLRARTLPDAEKRLTYGVFVFEAKHSVRSVLGYPGRSGARLPL